MAGASTEAQRQPPTVSPGAPQASGFLIIVLPEAGEKACVLVLALLGARPLGASVSTLYKEDGDQD